MRFTGTAHFWGHKGTIFGVVLGADRCAEHQCGIEEMLERLGVPQNPADRYIFGIDARMVEKYPADAFSRVEVDGFQILVLCEKKENCGHKACVRNLCFPYETKVHAAWDVSSLAIAVKGAGAGFLDELLRAFERKDISIWLGDGSVSPPGLIIVIASLVPPEIRAALYNRDAKRKYLADAVLATGIEAKLKAANKICAKFVPHWANDFGTTITFLVIPEDKESNNSGWFNLDDLFDWIEGRGRIPKIPA